MGELRARVMTRYRVGSGPISNWVSVEEARERARAYMTPTRDAWVEVERPVFNNRYGSLVEFDQVIARLFALGEELAANGEMEEWGGVQQAIKELQEARKG